MRINHLMNDSINVYGESSKNKFGEITYGAATAVSGRFVYENHLIYDPKGNEVNSDALAYLPAGTTVAIENKVVYDSTKYKILKIGKPKDHKSVKFIKLYLGSLA